MAQPSRQTSGLPIAAVEQATGIARATLRIWERRYGFPRPERDLRDERSYGAAEVEKLRLIACLVARGQRPGRLVPLPTEQLAALAIADPQPAAQAAAGNGEDPVLDLLLRHDTEGLAGHLEDSIRSLGLPGFIMQRMPVLNQQVGAGLARGVLEVYQEHLYTEMVAHRVHHALSRLPAAGAGTRPHVLLATLAAEAHGLGLLMAHALLAAHGCRCTSLGVRLPVPQLVSAASAYDCDIVGLSFSASQNPSQALRALEQLRGELPTRVAIWAGGNCPVLTRRRVPGVRAMPDIAEVPAALAAWRAQGG